jgi:hypothetical protein
VIDGGARRFAPLPTYGIRRYREHYFSSLRAQRSNPFFLCAAQMDCFAALAMTRIETGLRDLAANCARALHLFQPPKFRGRREGRVLAGTRGLVCNG